VSQCSHRWDDGQHSQSSFRSENRGNENWFQVDFRDKPDGITRIGKMIKERLGIDPDQTIGFNIHNEEKAAARNAKTKKFFV